MEEYDVVVIGTGEAGKFLAWSLGKIGRRTAVVERSLIGGSCPNIACLPSKNIIHSAKIASFARRGREFGLDGDPPKPNWKSVIARKQKMVAGLVDLHLTRFCESGVELIMGSGHFTGIHVS